MMNTFMGTNLRRLRSLPIVSIANGHGFVLGGATEMYASCDIRAAKKGTKIGFVQARMGISPGWAGASRIVEAIGRAKAIEVLAASSTFSADDAKAMGFVDFLYDERDEFEKYLSRFSKNSVGAIRSCKEMINAVCEAHSMEDKHMVERDVFIQVWGGPDNMAALSKNIKHK
uniref:Uncharacterized protein n=1 Tax=Panagrolaimus sp. JU765 TaxID=591449 RepID=A0AC34R1H2_9BILA